MSKLHIFFFPFMAHGHMIPLLDMAKLFALRGLKATIVTTPSNVPFFSRTVEKMKDSGADMGIQVVKFPSLEAGLPEGCENMDSITSLENGRDLMFLFLEALSTLQDPMEKLLQEFHPDCIIADMFFPWVTCSAAKFGIPRLVFHGTSCFASSIEECIRLYEPQFEVSSDFEPFIVPNLPGEIQLTRSQLAVFLRQKADNGIIGGIIKFLKLSKQMELDSFGVIVNSFYELEPDYADFYKNVLGRKAWHVGPVFLCNKGTEEKYCRGKGTSIDEYECLKWLDSKEPNSVIYIFFGTMSTFTSSQLLEIARALENSGVYFIWVVGKFESCNENCEKWSLEKFQGRVGNKGLIIRGWAPQVLILEHKSISGFVTHCGWNSVLEGITSGVPMITWPISADQFYNEKLITDVLKIGVGVGVNEWVILHGQFIKSEAIEKAINTIFVGEEATEMRRRAQVLGEIARKSVQEGGSSYKDLDALTEALIQHRCPDTL